MCVQIHAKLAQKGKKCLRKAQAIHHFQIISCSREMYWNFHSVKCMDQHVDIDHRRKIGCQEAEFQDSKRMNMLAARREFS